MRQHYYILFLILIVGNFSIEAAAQVTISGKVTDGKKEGVSAVNVMVTESFKSATIIAYTLTDNDGNYVLKPTSTKDSLYITFKGFNIKAIKREFRIYRGGIV